MGKDTLLKNTTSNSRLYSPWQLDQNETCWIKRPHRFGLMAKEDDFEACIDEDMTRTIQRIEQEQQERIQHLREEEEAADDEGFISRQAQNLDIHASSAASNQTFQISLLDQDSSGFLLATQEQQRPLMTLKETILSKEASKKDQSLSATNSQVIQIYKKMGCLLARFQSTMNRLPKALKIIPSLSNWNEILLLTEPSSWTPQATCEMTRLFLTNVKATQTRQYFQCVLLHAVRDNLAKNANSQLDPALYMALKKALACNPALFMKGLLFPLCESNTCTVAEACILANVLGETKIPALQSATALLRLSEQLFTLPICILAHVFLQKRQALPYRVVDMLTFKYFCQREENLQQLPILWYQSLLIFTQSYSMDMVPTQKTALLASIQRVTRNDEVSILIEKTLTSAIKSSDQELTTDDSDDTVDCNEDTDSERSADGMMLD